MRNLLLILLVVTCTVASAFAQTGPKPASVPIIYTTDLYHPHDDPDDHFDLATLFALPEFDLRAIVIDTGRRGANRPGTVAIRQLLHLTGRTVSYATGLTGNLRSPDDRAQDQPTTAQAGVELILRQLRESKTPVTIITAGSLRDVAAAFNRDPVLFKANVARLYLNVGNSDGGKEWNVDLDRQAFVRILTSGLPVFWVPCFGADGWVSLWSFRQGDVLDAAPLPLQNYIVYALTKASPAQRDPLKALTEPIPDELKKKLWAQQRNMWCTAAFLHAAGRPNPTFSFEKVPVRIDENGVTRIVAEGDGRPIMTFHRTDPVAYGNSMRETLRELLAGMGSGMK